LSSYTDFLSTNKSRQQEIRLMIPSATGRSVVGPGGSTVKRLCHTHGCDIDVRPKFPPEDMQVEWCVCTHAFFSA
jgi:hypothetical protein